MKTANYYIKPFGEVFSELIPKKILENLGNDIKIENSTKSEINIFPIQEYLQSKKIDVPIYEVLAIEGEAHCQTFRVECKVAKFNITAQGEGSSRRNAEQEAAKLVYQQITA